MNKEGQFLPIFSRLRAAGLLRLSASIVIVMSLLSGCAVTPASPENMQTGRDGSLYSGQPEVVYSTEFPVASADDARARAAEAVNEGDLDRALYFYTHAASLDPDDAAALSMIGAIHERRGNTSLAGRAYARAVEVDPTDAIALQGLGIAYFDSRELEMAQSILERATELDADLWRAHNVLGVIADTRGEHALAADHFTAALEVRGGQASIFNNRGYSRYLAGNFAAAEKDFLAALSLDGTYDRARRNLGLLYARQGDYDAALRELSLVSSKHVAANDLGYIAMLDGSYDVAGRYFAEAIRLSPRYYATAEENLAMLRELSGNPGLVESYDESSNAASTDAESVAVIP